MNTQEEKYPNSFKGLLEKRLFNENDDETNQNEGIEIDLIKESTTKKVSIIHVGSDYIIVQEAKGSGSTEGKHRAIPFSALASIPVSINKKE